jgi:hypothetical protein
MFIPRNTSIMEEEMKLTGIAIGYDNNLIYECSNPVIIEEFKAYLDSSELKKVDVVNFWLEINDKIYFLRVKPAKRQNFNNEWTVNSDEIPDFSIVHIEGKNLLNEILEKIRTNNLISAF